MCELSENYTIVIVTHNMQQAARASDETVFLTMGDDRAGYLVETGPDQPTIFTNPKQPADRGLRLRSVRLEERAMTRATAEHRRSARSATAQAATVAAQPRSPRRRRRAGTDRHAVPRHYQSRHARPRGAGDQGQRAAAGQPGRRPDRCAPSTRWSSTTPTWPLAVIAGDGRLNEAQRHITALVARTIATQQPVARDLRFLLALDHVAYDLERMGDHAVVGRQAGAQAGADADAEAPTAPAGDGPARRASWCADVLRALVDLDDAAGARGGGPRRRHGRAVPRAPSPRCWT